MYRKFLPGLFVVLHINEVGIESEGSILLLMLQIVLYVCAGLLPDEIARLIQYKLQQIMAGAWQLRIDTSAIPMADSDKWAGFYQFGVILIFLVLFAIHYALCSGNYVVLYSDISQVRGTFTAGEGAEKGI